MAGGFGRDRLLRKAEERMKYFIWLREPDKAYLCARWFAHLARKWLL